MKIKQILSNGRVIVLMIALVLGLFAIAPQPWVDGVTINSITKNSSAELAGIEQPAATTTPTARERITAIDNKPITSLADYYEITKQIQPNQTIQVKTNKGLYRLVTRPQIKETTLNETELITINKTITENGTEKNITITEERPKIQQEIIGTQPLGFSVTEAPTSNLRKGLDLQGGTRVILKPTEETTVETLDLVVESLKQRLNIYGLSDIVVTQVSDRPDILGGGNRFILVEIAGATEQEVQELLSKQGKFEAKIGNTTVFKGGNDITYVCRTADCSGIDTRTGCGPAEGGYACRFQFAITLDPEAAKRQADATRNLKVTGTYLEQPLTLFLDDQQVDELQIAADLRGRSVTEIAITGSGGGVSQDTAITDTLANMKRLQTVLITGSLPVKLTVERIDNISPSLGKTFLDNAIFVGMISLLAVVSILVIRYRRAILAIPIIIASLSELFLTIATAALIGWSLDLAAIAGIILAVGTGVDDQIVITDESIKGQARSYNWKERIRRAFFIIMSAYFTVVVAMVPLLFAGAGLLKGFAITTILGVSIGVFITRPAFAAIVEKLLSDEQAK